MTTENIYTSKIHQPLWRWGIGRHKRGVSRELAKLMVKTWQLDDRGLDGRKIFQREKRDLIAEWFCLKIEEKYRELQAQNALRAMFGGDVMEMQTIGLPDNIPQLRKIYDQFDELVVPVFGGCEI